MFRTAAIQIRKWWSASTADILGADLASASAEERPGRLEDAYPHAHRLPLRSRHERRPGMVAPRPAICISPVPTRAESISGVKRS